MFLRPASPSSEVTFDSIHAFILTSKPVEVSLVDRGDTLVIDNWRMLHGRKAAPINAMSRQIERAYIGDLN